MKAQERDSVPGKLLENLGQLPRPFKYWVGFSGGADSTALLQVLHECRSQLGAPLHAIHFHHGLQPGAEGWQEHCRQFCEERDIPFISRRLEVIPGGKTSLEEEARNARYRAVAEILGEH